MRARSILWGLAVPAAALLLAGCSGKKPMVAPSSPPVKTMAPAPTPATVPAAPAATTAPAPAPTGPAARFALPPTLPATGAKLAPTAAKTPAPPAKPKEVVLTFKPDPNHPGQMIPVGPKAAPPAPRPAAQLNLATAEEKTLGIPVYPGATRAGGLEAGKGEVSFDQRLVLYTPDSPAQVEAFYRKQFPGTSQIGTGKVGDQAFTNMSLEGSGPAQKRAFFFIPSGSKKTKIELTLGTGK